jgi:uncharacterized protein YdaU (DUF1376 family)
MPLYIGDYLRDTGHLSAEEHGAYLMLLMAAWTRDGKLPTEPRRLAALAHVPTDRWPTVWSGIAEFFEVTATEVTQKRLLIELAAAKARKEIASEKGKKGANSKWRGRAQGLHQMPDDCPDDGTGNATANGTGNGTGIAGAMPEGMAGGMPGDGSPASASSSTSSSQPPPPAPSHAHTTARARARDVDVGEDQGLDAKAAATRKAALGIADDWRPLRRKVDPADPATATDDAWSLAREEQAGHVVRLLQAGHAADLIRQTLTWAMHDHGDGLRFKGWRYQVGTLADFGLHFAKIRKALVAAQAPATPPPEPPPRPGRGPEPPDYQAQHKIREAEEAKRRAEERTAVPPPPDVRSKLRAITGGSP